jgi:hypothetical protein
VPTCEHLEVFSARPRARPETLRQFENCFQEGQTLPEVSVEDDLKNSEKISENIQYNQYTVL